MSITLNELIALRQDTKTMARIDELLEQRSAAEKAIEQGQLDLLAANAALAELGIDVEEEAEDEAAVAKPRKPGRPRREPGPVGATESRRGTDEYVDALDSIGREFAHTGRYVVTGNEIVKAMAGRGFPSKQGVMRCVKSHERWSMSGSRRGTKYQFHPEGKKRTRPARP